MAAAGAQFNYAVFVRGRDLSYLWCVCVCVCLAHAHTHMPTPPPTLSNTHTHMHMSSRACIPKGIFFCLKTRGGKLYAPIYNFYIYIYLPGPQVERQSPPNLSILISGGKETNR